MSTSLRTRVDAELIRHLYVQFPVSQAASLAALVAIVIGLWREAPAHFLMLWVALHLVVLAARFVLRMMLVNHEPIVAEDMHVWGYRFSILVALSGALWGWAGYRLMEISSFPSHILLMFALGGIVAGASQSLASWMKAYFAFCLPLTIPPTLWMLSQADTTHKWMSLLMVLFITASAALARKSGHVLRQSYRLRFENEVLLEEVKVQMHTRELSQSRLQDYNLILEKLARHQPFDTVLGAVNNMLERQLPNTKSAIVTLDETNNHLHVASAPNLPVTYIQVVNDSVASSDSGSCGKALSTNQKVSTVDIATDPLWVNYKDIALAHGLAACTSVPIHDAGGKAVGAFSLYHAESHQLTKDEDFCLTSAARLAGLVLERKRAEDKLHHLAHHDLLTGLPNRALFTERLQHTLAWARRDKKKFALLFLDLDKFKAINDNNGHAIGDLVLQEVAARLKLCVRDVDTAARLGGDEFTVLLTDVRDAKSPALVANKIISLICEPILIEARGYSLGASVGISLYPADAHDTDQLMMMADVAMYSAKSLGGNAAVFYASVQRGSTAANDLAA